MPEELKKRSEVPVELTWDLSLLYKTDDEMYKDLKKSEEMTDELVKNYQGKLNTVANILSCVKDYEELCIKVYVISNYSNLAVSADHTDAELQKKDAIVSNTINKCFSKLTFIETEIAQASDEVLDEAIKTAVGNKEFIKEIRNKKAHQLSLETESVLTAIGQTLSLPYTGYETTKMADISFPNFEVNGKEYPLGYSLFEDHYEYEKDTEVRRAAFDAFSKKIREYQHTTANYYNTQVSHEKTMSVLRKYDSVFDYLLDGQHVSKELYNRQIDVIMEKLAPHMRKYAKLIGKVHNLDKVTFADLKLAIDPDYTPQVTIPEAKKYCKEGLAILGQDYVDMVEEAFTNRWIDFAQNIGKSTGGFCASPWGKNSYILLSYHGEMSDVFTLAHELGHAGHFRLCNNEQHLFDTEVSRYMIESPSTMNELIMANYLKTTSDDLRFKRWVLASQIQNTYYHNFVTHFMEAAYQREVYKIIDEGGSVQADDLSGIMKSCLEKFWGDAVEINDGAELTWMRQPHYYMGLYSYTYSAGLTVATAVARRIEKEGAPAVEDWKNLLRAGGTLDPVGLAKLAKVDISTDSALNDAIDYIGGIIDQICELTEQLEK